MKIIYIDEKKRLWMTEEFGALDGFAQSIVDAEPVTWHPAHTIPNKIHVVVRRQGRWELAINGHYFPLEFVLGSGQ